MKSEFLKAVTVKQETIKLDSLDGIEATIKELTIDETEKVEQVRQRVLKGELKDRDLIIESCKYSMIDPILDDETIKNLTPIGMGALVEIHHRIPEIGMNQEQREDYRKRLMEAFSNNLKKALSKEEIEKKPSKRKSSSLN